VSTGHPPLTQDVRIQTQRRVCAAAEAIRSLDGRARCAVAALSKGHGDEEVSRKMGNRQISEYMDDTAGAGCEDRRGSTDRRAGGARREESGEGGRVAM
jgi:hypothetical protein